MTERDRTYVDVVFAAADIYEQELRAAHRLKKKSLTGYMQAVDAATEKRDAVESAAWERFLRVGRTTAYRLSPTASATKEPS